MPARTTRVGEFSIIGDSKITTIILPECGHLEFVLGNGPDLAKMAGSLLRMTQLPIPDGTDMKFGSFSVTYTSSELRIKNSKSLLLLPKRLIHAFPDVVSTAISVSENAQKSRPGKVQSSTDARNYDVLSGQYTENP